MDLFTLQLGVAQIAVFALLLVKTWAFVDALVRPAEAFTAADKLTKQAWLLILGLSAVAQLFSGAIGLLAILGHVATAVYLVDVRPAVASMTRPRR